MSWTGKPNKNYKMMAFHGTLVCDSANWYRLTKLGLFFPIMCLIHVFDQTLAEQLYRDKRSIGRKVTLGNWSSLRLNCQGVTQRDCGE